MRDRWNRDTFVTWNMTELGIDIDMATEEDDAFTRDYLVAIRGADEKFNKYLR